MELGYTFKNFFLFLDQATVRHQVAEPFMFNLLRYLCISNGTFLTFLFCSISGDLLRIEGKILHSILDEVIFKLLSTPSPVLRSTATKLLLLMAESHQEILILLRLSACYKGNMYSFFEILKNNIFIVGFWKVKFLF